MRRSSNKIVWFGLIALLLIAPHISTIEASGFFKKVKKPTLSLERWQSGGFQKKIERYIKNSFNLRDGLVRVYNQIEFSLFNSGTKGIVIGKNGFLFQKEYIDALTGKDYLGDEIILKKCTGLKNIQKKYKENGTHLIFIFAAGKASFMPENIPEHLLNTIKKSNYQNYKSKFDSLNIEYIDFNDYFLKLKKQETHPLFPKYGVHWNRYGEYIVADSLTKYVSKTLNTNIDLVVDSLFYDTINLGRDYDLGKLMNLIYPLPRYPSPHVYWHISYSDSLKKPSSIIIGDSYYSGLNYDGLTSQLFQKGQFWYYNKRAWIKNGTLEIEIPKKEKLNKFLFKQKFIFILSTEANLDEFPFGFNDL